MIEKADLQMFLSLFERDNILILMHRSPDGDTLGSGFALMRLLKKHGKKVCVACNDEVPKKLDFFSDGVHETAPEFEPDTIVSVDMAAPEMFGKKYEHLAGSVWLSIDHHATNTAYAENTIVYPEKSATAELLSDLIDAAGFEIDDKIAMCLYGAIASDTGCFKFANVTPQTHLAAARLLEYEFDAATMNRKMFEVAPLKQLRVESTLLQNAELFCGGKIALVLLTRQMLKEADATDADFEGLTSVARRIEGAEIGITMRENADGDFRISLRSECEVDVSAIAASFGGGGHIRAAGCTLEKPLENAKKTIVEAIEKALKK